MRVAFQKASFVLDNQLSRHALKSSAFNYY